MSDKDSLSVPYIEYQVLGFDGRSWRHLPLEEQQLKWLRQDFRVTEIYDPNADMLARIYTSAQNRTIDISEVGE